jgi:hypothetical protein
MTLMVEIENCFQFQESKYRQVAGECQRFFIFIARWVRVEANEELGGWDGG